MKKLLIVAVMALMLLGFDSCQKHKYCQCYAYIDGEDVPLGEDLDISSMTAANIEESLETKYKYNLYIIESGTCNDKAKEIVGWGNRVTCREVDTKTDNSWFENLFNHSNNNNNNNSGNHTNKP